MNAVMNRYVYDGWLVLEVRDGANNVLENYTHGPDLSGRLGGAGGIGGILAATHTGETNATYFYHYDGNGNVVRLTDTNGAVVATLDYDPFGHVLISSGPYPPRYQFSTKECDGVAGGLSYYGFRFYSPTLGRWISRDPVGEYSWLGHFGKYWTNSFQLQFIAKRNEPAYLFAYNAPVDRHDFLGLVERGGIRCGTNCTMEVTGCDTFPAVLQSCCNAHEQCHIGQVSSSFCKKKGNCCPDAGKRPKVPDDVGGRPLWPDLECPCNAVEVTCLRGLSGLSPADEAIVNQRIIQLLGIMSSRECPQNP